MRISPAGVALGVSFEKWRSKAYRDSGGKWTIGWGHLIRPNELWMITATLTREQGDRIYQTDVRLAEACVNDNLVVIRNLATWEFDAIVDFVFNCGCRNFRTSTLLKRLKKGDPRAADELLIWNRDAIGEVRRGLIRRRAVEWNMFQGKEVDLT